MPNYDYLCSSCGHCEEILQKMSDALLKECPQCKKATFQRKFGSGIGLHFQGSGFYATDYNQPPAPAKEPPSPPPAKGCGCGKTACSDK